MDGPLVQIVGTVLLLIPFGLIIYWFKKVDNKRNKKAIEIQKEIQRIEEYYKEHNSQCKKAYQEKINELEALARDGDPIALEEWKELTGRNIKQSLWFFFWWH